MNATQKLLAGVVFTTGVVGGAVVMSRYTQKPGLNFPVGENQYGGCCSNHATHTLYGRHADIYDREVVSGERLLGVTKLRKRILSRARGDVLELAAGTGANLEYYSAATVRSVLMTDFSAEMLVHGKLKYKEQVKKASEAEKDSPSAVPPVLFELQDAHELVGVPDRSKDTVVDSFGLCSYADPARALKEMQRVCKPDGEVLLLEHGASAYTLVTRYLNWAAPAHAQRWGCWFNRPIEKMITDSGLEITSVERTGLGTFYAIVAKPGPRAQDNPNVSA